MECRQRIDKGMNGSNVMLPRIQSNQQYLRYVGGGGGGCECDCGVMVASVGITIRVQQILSSIIVVVVFVVKIALRSFVLLFCAVTFRSIPFLLSRGHSRVTLLIDKLVDQIARTAFQISEGVKPVRSRSGAIQKERRDGNHHDQADKDDKDAVTAAAVVAD